MSRLSRITQLIFGSSAIVGQMKVFGSLANATPTTATDIGTGSTGVQNLSQFLSGWFAGILGGGNPAIEDMNGLFWMLTQQLAYIFQAGIPEWDFATTYFKGSIVQDGGSSGAFYLSLIDNNLNQALSGGNWQPFLTPRATAGNPGNLSLDGNAGASSISLQTGDGINPAKMSISERFDMATGSTTGFQQLADATNVFNVGAKIGPDVAAPVLKTKRFTGTLTTGSHTILSAPSGTVVGAIGMTTVGGNGGGSVTAPMVGESLANRPSGGWNTFGSNTAQNTLYVQNVADSAGQTNDYDVTMFYV